MFVASSAMLAELRPQIPLKVPTPTNTSYIIADRCWPMCSILAGLFPFMHFADPIGAKASSRFELVVDSIEQRLAVA